jgi:hypothetical protein
MAKNLFILLGVVFFALFQGCTQHRVEVAPVEVKPIHITIDVNVKVDRALDDFFEDIDAEEEKVGDKTPINE